MSLTWTRDYEKNHAQLSMKFKLLLKTKMLKNKEYSCLKFSDFAFVLPICLKKCQQFLALLTFMSRLISCLVELSMKKSSN